MGEVNYFNNGDQVIGPRGANDSCVEVIEDLLAKAKNGEIIGVAGAVQYADGSSGTTRGGFLYNTRIVGCLMSVVTKLSSE